ncbi:hypothetical protein GN244_ATG16772 [Phytophthora infestans]|uniref:Crinkler (CRN) family protein n=1 Tax=Phytophthora infestans TaxID=4787 RepID=A0A833RRD5_PHYIN|nr:hypothetical protein GN244_ATG16772 [Phytophthora infestans]
MKEENGKQFFFILDEMTPNARTSVGGKSVAAFQRNIFRTCGLVVIVMGTDSKKSNLVTQATGSSTGKHMWMSIVPKFPPYRFVFDPKDQRDQEVWEAAVDWFPVVEYIARAAKQTGDGEYSTTDQVLKGNEAFAGVSRGSQIGEVGKAFMDEKHGRYAQLMAISYTNAEETDEEPPLKKRRLLVGAESMHLHFANLVDEKVTDVIISNGELNMEPRTTGPLIPWAPQCCFSQMDKDVLLYLAILGGKTHSGYYQYTRGGVAHSTKFIFSESGAFPVHENKNAVSNEYKTYENMVAHALFCSSRRHGVQGISFDDFLECLVGEFRDKIWEKVILKDLSGAVCRATELLASYEQRIRDLSTRTMPFVAPPNAEWPQPIIDMNVRGCEFGHLIRAPNSERCDIFLDDLGNSNERAMFLCECKYRGDNVDMGVLKGIVAGLNQKWDWKIGMLFCPQLANVRAWTVPDVDCMKIDCKTGNVKWVHRPNAERGAPKVIIVIETGRGGGVVG